MSSDTAWTVVFSIVALTGFIRFYSWLIKRIKISIALGVRSDHLERRRKRREAVTSNRLNKELAMLFLKDVDRRRAKSMVDFLEPSDAARGSIPGQDA